MKLQKIDGNVLTLMLALAFFNFIFLGTEYQFDNMAALVTEPEQVVTAQGYVLGASVLGFLLYPAMASCRKIKEKLRQILVKKIQGVGLSSLQDNCDGWLPLLHSDGNGRERSTLLAGTEGGAGVAGQDSRYFLCSRNFSSVFE